MGGLDSMRATQVDALVEVQQAAYTRHRLGLTIVIAVGDVPCIPIGGGRQLVSDGSGGLDLWVDGDLKHPDVSLDDALALATEAAA